MQEDLTSPQGADKKFTVEVDSPSQTRRVMHLKIFEEFVAHERDLIARKLRQDLKVPGFRKGKIPASYVEKNYGDVIQGDAVRNLLPIVFHEAVMDSDLRPIGDPSFENLKADPGEGIHVDAVFDVPPDVTITGYDKVSVEVEKKAVEDSAIDETIETIRDRFATLEVVERASNPTDFLTIDLIPYNEAGELDEAQRNPNHMCELGSDNLLKEFREGLVGLKAGDSADITVKYPDDFPEETLKGQERKFHVEVKEVKDKLLPELDDNFAKRVGEFENMDALRKQMRENHEAEEERRYNTELNNQILDKLMDLNPFEVPEVMIENYIEQRAEEYKRMMPKADPSQDTEMKELLRESAVRAIGRYLVIDAVKKQESVEVGNDEVDARLEKVAADSKQPLEELKKQIADPRQRARFIDDLADEKVLNIIREKVDI